MPVWARVLVCTLGIVVVLVAAAAAWFVTMLAGGLDDLLGDPRTPDDPAVVEAYERTRPINGDALQDTVSGLDGPLGHVERLGSSHRQSCNQGQHNWKIDDPFDLWCSLTDSTLVSVNALPTFRDDMLAVDAHLTAQGWTGDNFDIPYVLTEYWDHRAEFEVASPDRSYPHGLPSVGYDRGEEQLSIDWAVHGRAAGPYETQQEWVDARGDHTELETLATQVPVGSYGLVVTITRDYFYE